VTLLSDSLGSHTLDRGVPIASALALLILTAVFVRASVVLGGEELRRIPRLVAIGLAWLLTQLLLAAGSIHFTPRYFMALVFPTAMMLGALAEGAVLAWRRGNRSGRAWAIATTLVIFAAATLALRGSPLFRPYPELARASRIHGQLLDAVALRIESADELEVIQLEVPRRVAVESRAVGDFWILSHWGLQAWLDMVYPEQAYEVVMQQRPGVPHGDFAAVTLQRR
jgi:hypothetical protein